MNQITKQIKFDSDLVDQVKVESDGRTIGYANKYKVKITYQKRSGVFEFTDSVHNTNEGNEPKKEDVLYCLLMDNGCQTDDFETFCNEFGYDTDSRKAEGIYKAVLKNQKKMERIFGSDIDTLSKEYEDY